MTEPDAVRAPNPGDFVAFRRWLDRIDFFQARPLSNEVRWSGQSNDPSREHWTNEFNRNRQDRLRQMGLLHDEIQRQTHADPMGSIRAVSVDPDQEDAFAEAAVVGLEGTGQSHAVDAPVSRKESFDSFLKRSAALIKEVEQHNG